MQPMAATAPAANTARPTLKPELFKQFSDYIYQISGIRFLEAKAYFLTSKLQNRCDALLMKSFEEYLAFLKTPAAKLQEHHLLMDQITINETFFFRNEPQLESFEKDYLTPMIMKRKAEGKTRIRIWSCASSTGDEAYTTVLQILSNPIARGMQFEIIGTDICRDALAKAQKGSYKKYAIRNIPLDMLNRYFVIDPNGLDFHLKEDVKRMVRFQECNLIDEARIRMLGRFDFVFCRNVLIYFDGDSKEVALKNIYNALNDDGFLMAGHSENLYSHRHIFKVDKTHTQAHAYVKAPPGTPKSQF